MDEKGANTFPFHYLPLELKKTSKNVFPVLFTLSLLDKRKVGGDSCYLQQLRSNAKQTKSVLPPYYTTSSNFCTSFLTTSLRTGFILF